MFIASRYHLHIKYVILKWMELQNSSCRTLSVERITAKAGKCNAYQTRKRFLFLKIFWAGYKFGSFELLQWLPIRVVFVRAGSACRSSKKKPTNAPILSNSLSNTSIKQVETSPSTNLPQSLSIALETSQIILRWEWLSPAKASLFLAASFSA